MFVAEYYFISVFTLDNVLINQYKNLPISSLNGNENIL